MAKALEGIRIIDMIDSIDPIFRRAYPRHPGSA